MANRDQSVDAPSEESLVEEFRNPDREFGPVPLWWWDGEELDDERMTWQLERLNDAGVPSVCYIQKYPNGPTGDDHDYFSEDWWESMEHVARECDRLDMDLWVHDETYHHSPPTWREFWQDYIRAEASANPDLRGRVLDRVSEDATGGESVSLDLSEEFSPIAVAAYPREDGGLRLDEAVELDADGGAVEWTAPEGEWHVAAVGTRPHGLRYTTSDAVERYIDLHFEEYRRRLGDLVGDVLVGTFEDELVILDDEVPCDEVVLDRFREEKGYDPASRLIGLYEDVDESTADFRTDYYDVVTTLLEENWFEPLYDWHEEHGLVRSHDNWGRNDLTEQITQYGDYYRTMRWYQVPGYDDGGPEAIGSRNFFDAKLSASIAACYDRPRVWGELFHSTGWGFTPEAQLAGIAENVCYGMNLYDKHGLYYTTLGGWWEHAPGDVHFRQPYWEHVDGLNDAATRLSYLFSQGTPSVDVAMLYPATSLHAEWRADDGIGAAGERVDERTRELTETLYKTGTDLVIADHESLDGAAGGDGRLEISDMSIPVLLLGPTTAVRRSTLRTIREHYDRGGIVLAAGRLPATAVGDGDEDVDDVLGHVFGEGYRAATRGEVDGVGRNESENGGVGVIAPLSADFTGLIDGLIDRDVRTDADDLYRAHRRVDDRDVYLLFNAREEERSATVHLRGDGRPRRWDALSGEVGPVREYDREEGYVRLDLEFAPHDFHVVSLEPDGDEPRVLDSSLASIEAVTDAEDGIRVRGTARASGSQSVRVASGTDRYEGESDAVSVPEARDLSDGWEFSVEPVLDNRWGDYRYPADDSVIGPEVRQFSHRPERPGVDGIEQGWHRPAVRADDWEEVSWSYGPYFWTKTGVENGDPGPTPESDPSDWEPYSFSKRFGKPGTHPYLLGYNSIISEGFLVSPEGDGTNYFWTSIRAPESETVAIHYGPGIERILLGEQVIVPSYEEEIGDLMTSVQSRGGETAIAHVPAGSTSVLVMVEPGVETYVAAEPTPGTALDRDMKHVPRLRWFDAENPLELDYRPWDDSPVGWYRFDLPAGTREFTLPTEGACRVWIDGDERPVADGRVSLDAPIESRARAAVRVEQRHGAYGGAAWTGPVTVDTRSVTVDAGDWQDFGLATYSGTGSYRKSVSLPEVDDGDRVVLDLGDVAVTASVAVNGQHVGTAFARPFEFDVSEAVRAGENEIEVVTANTLASHFAAETPRRYAQEAVDYFSDVPALLPTVERDDFVSGLLGPVTLRIEPSVSVDARR